jgi:hypothetical protein
MGGQVPGPADTAVFDGSISQQSCNLNQGAIISELEFQNGYRGTLTLGPRPTGPGYSLVVENDATLANLSNGIYVPCNIWFAARNLLDLRGPTVLANFNFGGPRGGVDGQNGFVEISGASRLFTTVPSPTIANFLLDGRASMLLFNSAPVEFKRGATLTIASGGNMAVLSGGLLLDSNELSGGELINNGTISDGGPIGFNGVPATIAMELENNGTLNISGARLDFTPATIIGSRAVNCGGQINFSNGATLGALPWAVGADGGGLDFEGTLTVTDNSQAIIVSPSAISSSGVIQMTSSTGFGQLMFTGTLSFNGTYVCRYNPQQPGMSNLLAGWSLDSTRGTLRLIQQPAGALAAGTWNIGRVLNPDFLVSLFPNQTPGPPPQQQRDQTNTILQLLVPRPDPQAVNPGDQVNRAGDTVSLQIAASDSDSGALTFSASGLPGGLNIGSSTGIISGTMRPDTLACLRASHVPPVHLLGLRRGT